MFELDKSSFDAAVLGCGGNPTAEAGEQVRLLRAYNQSHRSYHTTQHLAECLAYLQQAQSVFLQREIAEMALALWYHDAVYRPQRGDNEVRSACWLRFRARQFGFSPGVTERIASMILATRHGFAALPEDAQTQHLLDIDLAILAASAERFQQYCAQIRSEYAFVPTQIFKLKRAQVLREFLTQPKIYRSPFGAKFESVARLNLKTEISKLMES